MCRSTPSPSAVDGQEHVRQLLDKRRLLLWREHQISVALFFVRQRRENPSPYAEVHRTHVRALFHPFQTQRNPPKVACFHVTSRSRLLHEQTASQGVFLIR